MEVYRIEHENGWGPYRNPDFSDDEDIRAMLYDHGNYENNPSREKTHSSEFIMAFEVGGKRFFDIKGEDDGRFAFAAIPFLLRWFEEGDHLLKLAEKGFSFVTYEVSQRDMVVHFRTGQLLFRNSAARKLEKVPLFDFLERVTRP